MCPISAHNSQEGFFVIAPDMYATAPSLNSSPSSPPLMQKYSCKDRRGFGMSDKPAAVRHYMARISTDPLRADMLSVR
jgi:dienelactone hydrolase